MIGKDIKDHGAWPYPQGGVARGEILEAMRKLKEVKTIGIDGIAAVMLKHREKAVERMLWVINQSTMGVG